MSDGTSSFALTSSLNRRMMRWTSHFRGLSRFRWTLPLQVARTHRHDATQRFAQHSLAQRYVVEAQKQTGECSPARRVLPRRANQLLTSNSCALSCGWSRWREASSRTGKRGDNPFEGGGVVGKIGDGLLCIFHDDNRRYINSTVVLPQVSILFPLVACDPPDVLKIDAVEHHRPRGRGPVELCQSW